MNGVSKLSLTEDVTMITFNKAPANLDFAAEIFELFAKEEINVDMISQIATTRSETALSFTVPGDSLGKVLEIIARFQSQHPSVKPLVSSENCKISLFGAEMPNLYGVAARALRALADAGEDVLMITTSEVDISVLIPNSGLGAALDSLKQAFGVEC